MKRILKKSKLRSCIVCLEKRQPQIISRSLKKCSHVICKDCLAQYLEMEILNGKFLEGELKCANVGCDTLIDDEIIFDSISADVLEKLFRWRKREDLSKVQCPKSDCLSYFYADSRKEELRCTVCQHIFCTKCFKTAHGKESCTKAANDEKLFSKWVEEKNKDPKAVQVQRCFCGSVIEKNGGCPHMTCSKCKAEFCWFCHKKWSPAHVCFRKRIATARQQIGPMLSIFVAVSLLLTLFIGCFYSATYFDNLIQYHQ
mmetsp:Transcript_2614/g.3451  ORF Transcript_2614/g.3451 Transcript_2614/m.3451 type:complete len:257 (+) Transcript_2614:153-923(+)